MSLPNTPEKFWSRVRIGEPDECWEWQGGKNNLGYGLSSWQGRCVTAHRLAMHLTNPRIPVSAPKDRLGTGFMLHQCDNPCCCNPKHIEIGTYSKNQKEAYERKRRAQPKGQYHSMAKITNAQASQIRIRSFLGESSTKLAVEFGVSQPAISQIRRGVTYK